MSSMGVPVEKLAELAAPTPGAEIKQRVLKRAGGSVVLGPDGQPMMLSYVDARFVQDRLDKVVGPANWQSAFQDTMGGIRAGIGILIAGGDDEIAQWVWKFDAGVPSDIEPVKGAHSDAFKRAAVQWGIARDLYSADHEAAISEPAAPQQTVAEQVGHSRAERYEPDPQTGYVVEQAPAHPAPAAAAIPDGTLGPLCPVHNQQMIHKSGTNRANKPYSGFFCQVRNCPTPPQWDPR